MKKSMFFVISLLAVIGLSSCTKSNNHSTSKVVDIQPTVEEDTDKPIRYVEWGHGKDLLKQSAKIAGFFPKWNFRYEDGVCSADCCESGKVIATYSVKRCYQPVANWEQMESLVRPARYYDKGIHPYDIIYRGDKETIILTILFPEKELAKDWIL
jgi:hypothetical protein